MTRIIYIDTCKQCPHLMDMPTETFCNLTGRDVVTYTPDQEDCPLPQKKEWKEDE